MYTKFILNRDDIISIIALLSELRRQVKDLKNTEARKEILDFMYANFDSNDVKLFNSIERIQSNIKYLELEN